MVGEMVAADGPVHRVLRWRPLSEMGKLSYGMYLIHFLPMLVGHWVAARLPWTGARPFAAFAVAAGGSVAAAWVLAVTVERPFIRLGAQVVGPVVNPKPTPADPIPDTPTPPCA